jgi:broad specificity phosphatase PhoE
VIRVLLAHYLGLGLGSYHRLRVTPGSLSVVRFHDDRELPRILAINSCPGSVPGHLSCVAGLLRE